MELYRFTGALTGLLFSGGIALFFFICGRSSGLAGSYDGTIFYTLVPPFVLFGFIFDSQAIWKRISRFSQMLRPSYIGSGMFWMVAWPFCKLIGDLLVSTVGMFQGEGFVVPYYLQSLGFTGILGFFFFQAIVGTGMGLMFFMIYRPIFEVVSVLRVRFGLADPDYELNFSDEMSEFGFRK